MKWQKLILTGLLTSSLDTSERKPSSRGPRLQARQERKKLAEAAQSEEVCSLDADTEDSAIGTEDIAAETEVTEKMREGTEKAYGIGTQVASVRSDILEEQEVVNVSTQTNLSSAMISGMEDELKRLLVENVKLKTDAENSKFNEKFFEGNDEKVKFFTGLPNVTTLMILFEYLRPSLRRGSRCALSPFEMMVLVFMRLRFNLPFQLLAYIMKLSRTTVSSYFHSVINAMFVRMRPFIIWPERDVLRDTQPTDFRQAFGGRIAVIIDCFEIFIEAPSDLMARAQTFSVYKHHNTVKYLIGITPAGAISYISRGWGGRTSDRHIAQNSDFVNHLLPGDVVLADRGFDIADVVGHVGAEVKIPAFTKGKPQLSAYEVESTRKIAHLRIHVERVIGSMCGKYTTLNGVVPLEMLSTAEGEDRCTLDKIVTVCCGLVNLCESVVPMR